LLAKAPLTHSPRNSNPYSCCDWQEGNLTEIAANQMTASQDFITIYDSRDFNAHNLCKVHLRIISRNVKFAAKKAGSKNFGSNTYIEKLGSCVSIDSTEDVIQQVDICFLIQSSSQLHSLLLTSTKIDSTLTNLCLVTMRQMDQVTL
jgi:hypothetical protein